MVEKENTVVLTELITRHARYQDLLLKKLLKLSPKKLQKELLKLSPKKLQKELLKLSSKKLFQPLGQQLQNQSTFPIPNQLVQTEVSHQTAVLTEDVDSIVVPTELQIQTVSNSKGIEHFVLSFYARPGQF
jgi:FKBP-type peptidyl-prolyl cis-trans isomerase (trigger factor)